MKKPRSDEEEAWEADVPMLPDIQVEDLPPNYIDTGLLDADGNRIVRARPTVPWFGFVPLEEKE